MKRYEAEPANRLLIDTERGELTAKISVWHEFKPPKIMLVMDHGITKEDFDEVVQWLTWMNEEVIPPPDDPQNRGL